MHMLTCFGRVEAVQICAEGQDTRTVHLYVVGLRGLVQIYVEGPGGGPTLCCRLCMDALYVYCCVGYFGELDKL